MHFHITQSAIQALHELAGERIAHLRIEKRHNDSLPAKDQDSPSLAIEIKEQRNPSYLTWDDKICFWQEDMSLLEHHTIDLAFGAYGKIPRIIIV